MNIPKANRSEAFSFALIPSVTFFACHIGHQILPNDGNAHVRSLNFLSILSLYNLFQILL